jgi:hypothetical protein
MTVIKELLEETAIKFIEWNRSLKSEVCMYVVYIYVHIRIYMFT